MATVGEVLDRFGTETLAEMSRAIRRSMAAHPEHATCDCPAIEALKVLIDRGRV